MLTQFLPSFQITLKSDIHGLRHKPCILIFPLKFLNNHNYSKGYNYGQEKWQIMNTDNFFWHDFWVFVSLSFFLACLFICFSCWKCLPGGRWESCMTQTWQRMQWIWSTKFRDPEPERGLQKWETLTIHPWITTEGSENSKE